MESARRYVDLIGADQILAEGRRAFEAGDYRWAVEILHKLVFADPDNTEARQLQADAYEQMGYQAEGPQWRGIFLSAALELREGVQAAPFTTVSPDTVLSMPLDILFDFAAVHVIGDRAADADIRIDYVITDRDEEWTTWIRRGVMHARPGISKDAQVTVSGPKAAVVGAVLQPAQAAQMAGAGHLTVTGDDGALERYAALVDDFDINFNIVTP